MTLIGPLVSVNLLNSKALTVSGGVTPSATSTRLPVGMLSKLQVSVKNTGASTNVTVQIYAVDAETGGTSYVLRPFTLGAGGSAGCYIEKDAIPKYIYAVATNADTANTAEITVSVDRWR